MGIAYAYVFGTITRKWEWVQYQSQYYSIFQGRTEKEVIEASEELRKQRSVSGKKYTVNAAQLAEYFRRYIIPKEIELKKRRDEPQNPKSFEVVDGGRSDTGAKKTGGRRKGAVLIKRENYMNCLV